jgi:branched-chain amino acid transport system permease protein
VSGHAAKVWGLTPELAILAGTASAAGIGAVTGWLAVRRQGIYFAMVTLALAQMVYFICVQAPFTYAEDGIQSIPRGSLFGVVDLSGDRTMYYLVFAVFMLGLLGIYRIIHSPFGQVLKSIRENEARALSLGYDVDRYKLVAFILSATLAGLAGATKSLAFGLATLTDVSWQMSGEVVLMTLLGGMGTIFGPVVGAAIVITMQNYLAPFGAWVTVTQRGSPGSWIRIWFGPCRLKKFESRIRNGSPSRSRNAGVNSTSPFWGFMTPAKAGSFISTPVNSTGKK